MERQKIAVRPNPNNSKYSILMLKLTSVPFSAMGTECCLHLYSSSLSSAKAIAFSAIQEVLRIEAYYSRYRTDSFLSQINLAAQHGNAIEVDDETAGLLDYAYACHKKSGGLFDITAGILRKAWNFSALQLPEQAEIDRLLPLIASIAMLKGPAGIDWLNELAARHLWMNDQGRQGGYLPTAF